MLKALDIVGLSWLTRLVNVARRSGTVPLEWQTGVVFPIFKKGERRMCSNYRGITLLSLPGNVYSRVLERRLGKGGGGVHGSLPIQSMCFVDLEKAYDRVPRGIMWGGTTAVGTCHSVLVRTKCELRPYSRLKVKHVLSGCWTPPRLSLVTDSVRDLHGQNLKAPLR